MNITQNEFTGMYAVPDHPITYANPAPWLIEEVRLEINPIKIWIRGKNSMWFRADQCWIHILEECQDYVKIKGY